ncbi:hypothetical protein SAMN05892877_111229 [Rhizobium subbaraonis]|uniref:Uncharacterized protein n=1 Tax=Rhizobium subbaraonis TaxID=908946 RepID=A0A285UPV5_9HYPH|nr:hypothetical protein [Rhizobium subbaraonis]SOC43783.1 hypothetical protein SAMN05892877_111229 [Rhizobium subbaraonis]
MNQPAASPAQMRLEALRTRAARASRQFGIMAADGELFLTSGEGEGFARVICICGEAPVDDRELFLHIAEDHFWLIERYARLAERYRQALAEIERLSPKPKPEKVRNFAAECAMKCKDDHLFRKFLHECHGADPSDLERLKTRVRSILGVQSMAELNTDENARKRWLSLRAEFDRWRKRK